MRCAPPNTASTAAASSRRLNWQTRRHQIEAGVWYENNEPAQHRVWYPFSAANNDLTPYDVPKGQAVFTQ